MNNTTKIEVPYSLTEEYFTDGLSKNLTDEQRDTLSSLADRGLHLNTWQLNELLEGGRGYGRTTLAYIKIAEQYKGTEFTINIEDNVTNPIYGGESLAVLGSNCKRRLFIEGLDKFLQTYYSDVFKAGCDFTAGVTFTPKNTKE